MCHHQTGCTQYGALKAQITAAAAPHAPAAPPPMLADAAAATVLALAALPPVLANAAAAAALLALAALWQSRTCSQKLLPLPHSLVWVPV